jgi:hypothetical protein
MKINSLNQEETAKYKKLSKKRNKINYKTEKKSKRRKLK